MAAAEDGGRKGGREGASRETCEFLDGEVILHKLINDEKFGVISEAPCLPPPIQVAGGQRASAIPGEKG